jgi:hypothetical protein
VLSTVWPLTARQEDRPGASNKQLAAAAEIGNTRCWILGQKNFYAEGSKM